MVLQQTCIIIIMGQPISCGENPQYQYEPEKEMCWKDEEVQKTCCIFACSDDDSRRCAGDYSYGYSDNQNTLSGHLTYLKNAVEGVYGTSLHETYVQGNHDRNPQGTGGLTGPGAHDADGYGVYVIDEDDYMWYNNDEARIQQTATNLGVYLAAKVAEKYTKPIFVVSHLPLHYSMRTVRDGDGQYANYIFDVLNAAGENGLNIIFLYGHNHSHGWDDYLGGSRVYLAKGDEIVIGQGSKTSYATKTLNFTYMNAGYTGYYSYNGDDKIDSAMGESAPLTMTLFKITDTQVTVSRYGRNGKEALKNKGESKCDYYTISEEAKNGCPTNSLTYNSDQYIALSEVRNLPAITINGTPVSEYKVDRATVEKLAVAVQNFDGYSGTISSKNEKIAKVDAADEGYTLSFPGETGTVEITATGTGETRAAGDSISATLNLTVTDSNAQPSERTYTRITSTSELEGGKQYLIIYTGGYFVLPEVDSDDSSRVGFRLESTELGGSETITGDYSAKEWTFEASGNDWKLKNGTQYAKFEKNGTRVNAVLKSFGDDYEIAGTDTFTLSDAGAGSYDFYLDAVCIYDPAGTNPGGEIGDAYKADGEGWPDIIEIRNNIINASTLSVDQTSANGIVFVDGASAATFEDYNNYGPNNEVYLAKGQAIAFKLNVADYSNIDSIQIAAKAPAGTSAIAQVSNGTPTPIDATAEHDVNEFLEKLRELNVI